VKKHNKQLWFIS